MQVLVRCKQQILCLPFCWIFYLFYAFYVLVFFSCTFHLQTQYYCYYHCYCLLNKSVFLHLNSICISVNLFLTKKKKKPSRMTRTWWSVASFSTFMRRYTSLSTFVRGCTPLSTFIRRCASLSVARWNTPFSWRARSIGWSRVVSHWERKNKKK